MPKYASLCTGIGGLDRAVEEVFGLSPAWFCEFDAACRTVLERTWPGVPIYEDVKATDWSQVEPVELLCAGYPCQPFSTAGKRGGVDDPRHLWPFVLDALRVLRPRVVVLENVAGHLSLGFDRVLADLAEAGFDAEWTVVRASDVGACHQRARLFVLAIRADSGSERRRNGSGELGRLGAARLVEGSDDADADEQGPQGREPAPGHVVRAGSGGEPPADADGRRRSERSESYSWPHGPGLEAPRGDDADGLVAAAADASDVGRQRGGSHGDGGPDLRTVIAYTDGAPWNAERGAGEAIHESGEVERPGRRDRVDLIAWGEYEPAIRRHEHALGRTAPSPVDERGRLAVPFVEWMQMAPAGLVDGLTRTQALRALGNVVVTPQAVHALKELIHR